MRQNKQSREEAREKERRVDMGNDKFKIETNDELCTSIKAQVAKKKRMCKPINWPKRQQKVKTEAQRKIEKESE